MPLILVVDRDERVPGRVRKALAPQGWTVAHVREVEEALRSAGSEAPDLFLVSSELPSAPSLLATFARRQGGPGTLALVAAGPGEGGAVAAPGVGEDATIARSFDEPALREAVDRILRTPDRPVRSDTGEPKLTSQDIFGDLVAEVEREAGPGAPPGVFPRPPQPQKRRPAMDDDIERKLEQTLSGVLGPRTPAASPNRPPAARPAGPRAGVDDLDKLISDTLSGLELPSAAARRRRAESGVQPRPPEAGPMPPPPAAPARPAGPGSSGAPGSSTAAAAAAPERKPARPAFDLSDLEALLARSRKEGVPAAPARDTAPPRPAARAPAAAPSDPAPPSSPGPVEPPPIPQGVPFRSLFAEKLQEVPEDDAAKAHSAGRAEAEFGQYRLLDRIGVGGMAEVWKARMTGVEGFQKTVAIKRILPHLTDSADFVEMFVDEAKLAAQLNHGNIIHIYDLGKLGDDYYIAMEHVEGENLRNILNRAREKGGPLPPGIALFIGARLASALDYAHRKRDFEDREMGLVHRDVSPQNVLVGYEGTIKLCDFGIVKAVSKSSHTQMGALKGKLQYMSPEQAWGKQVDGRSDIFSLGALLFEMLTGRRLFVGESEMEVLEAVRECRVQAPSELEPRVRPEVDAVVLKALAREAEDRFQTAGELERRLEEVLASIRPAPGQSELAAYMARLFDRGAAAPEAPAELPPPGAVGEPAGAEEVPAPRAAAPPAAPPPAETPAGEPPVPAPVAPEGGEAVEAVTPVRVVEVEEGGRRGKGLLVAAIVIALLAGALLVWYLLQRGPEETGAPEPPPAVEEPAVPAPEPREPPAGEAPDGTAAAGSAPAGVAGEEPAPADGELSRVIDRAVEEELARREELLRKQFEEEERRLQRQLNALEESERRQETREPPAEPPPPPPKPVPRPAAEAPSGGELRPAAAGTGAPAPAPGAPAAGPEAELEPEPQPPPEPRAAPPPPPAPQPAPRPPPKPAVREGELVSMGPGVQPPKLVRFDKPEYPPIARRLRIQGEVVVSVLVDETGQVAEARLVQSAGRDVGLDGAALEAARRAQYRPATKEGVRVKMWTTLRIPFKL